MHVIIGVDPHKASHQAVVVDDRESEIARISVRATRTQAQRLLAWAAPFERRTWAIEGADGLGYLLSQQLVALGERVEDACRCSLVVLEVELAGGFGATGVGGIDVEVELGPHPTTRDDDPVDAQQDHRREQLMPALRELAKGSSTPPSAGSRRSRSRRTCPESDC